MKTRCKNMKTVILFCCDKNGNKVLFRFCIKSVLYYYFNMVGLLICHTQFTLNTEITLVL